MASCHSSSQPTNGGRVGRCRFLAGKSFEVVEEAAADEGGGRGSFFAEGDEVACVVTATVTGGGEDAAVASEEGDAAGGAAEDDGAVGDGDEAVAEGAAGDADEGDAAWGSGGSFTAEAAAATAAAFSGGTLGVFTGSRGEFCRLRDEKNLSGFSDVEEDAASNLARPFATAPSRVKKNMHVKLVQFLYYPTSYFTV